MLLIPAWVGAAGRRGQWVFWGSFGSVRQWFWRLQFDTYAATTRLAAASWLFIVFFAIEILWWPRTQDRLLVNAGAYRASLNASGNGHRSWFGNVSSDAVDSPAFRKRHGGDLISLPKGYRPAM